MRNSPIAPPTVNPELPATASPKMTMAAPSLNRLSPSTGVVSRLSTPSDRKRAMTATGSVAEIRAPKARAAGHGTSTNGRISAPTRKVPIRVPPIARVRIEVRSVLSRLHGRWIVASKIKGGTSTPRMRSLDGSMSNAVVNESPRPTSTSATVNGTLILDTTIATAATIASRTTRVTSVERMAWSAAPEVR